MSNLVGLGLVPVALQVNQFAYPFSAIDVVASADTFIETEVDQKRLQICKPDVRVRTPTEDRPQELLVFSHDLILVLPVSGLTIRDKRTGPALARVTGPLD